MEKKDLKPAGVFKYFEEICQVPRPSKKEEKMIAYLKAFGAKHNLETKVDEAGNVLIKKPATPGKENLQTVVLQSHIDMVCEKNNDVQHDFLTDPIETEIDGEWLKAKGTTLGADNGIGVATELAILADDSIEHGPLECLFTVDEETGLTGAFALIFLLQSRSKRTERRPLWRRYPSGTRQCQQNLEPFPYPHSQQPRFVPLRNQRWKSAQCHPS